MNAWVRLRESIDVVVHFKPLTGREITTDERFVELLEPGGAEFLIPGSVWRCCAGLEEETDGGRNEVIEQLHERIRIRYVITRDDADAEPFPHPLVAIERAVGGTRVCWHDRGCSFRLVLDEVDA